ncbi:hypothetical protein ACWDTT_15770 [Streptosporangium sandarakinum]
MSEDRKYEVGETIHLQIGRAKVVDYYDDGETRIMRIAHGEDGALETMIQVHSKDVTITRVLPPAGEPKPNQVWTNAEGKLWFTVGPVGNVGLIDQRGNRDNIHGVHRDHGPIWPVWEQGKPQEKKSRAWYIADNMSGEAVDPDGVKVDLSGNFYDAEGATWYWLGVHVGEEDGAAEPLMSRGDGSRRGVRWSAIPGIRPIKK